MRSSWVWLVAGVFAGCGDDGASGGAGSTSSSSARAGVSVTGASSVSSATGNGSTSTGSGGTALVHGQSFVVTGDFVAKPMAAPLVWDDCAHGEDELSKWDAVYPNGDSGSTLPEERWACRETPFSRPTGSDVTPIEHPVARGTHIAAGGLTAPMQDANAYAVGANVDFDRPDAPFYTLSTWWERVDPAWNPGDFDNNFKLWDWSVGPGWYEPSSYWYIDYAQTEEYDAGMFRVDLGAPSYENNDDSSPTYLTPPHTWGEGGADARGWVLRTVVAYWADDPDGRVTLYEGQLPTATDVLTTEGQTADPYEGTRRNLAIGGYVRAVGFGTNWRYFAEMFQDVGEGWFYLTDAPTWEASTQAVLQPWTSVTADAATLICQGGSLPSGKVYLHYRLAPWKADGHRLLGEFDLE